MNATEAHKEILDSVDNSQKLFNYLSNEGLSVPQIEMACMSMIAIGMKNEDSLRSITRIISMMHKLYGQ